MRHKAKILLARLNHLEDGERTPAVKYVQGNLVRELGRLGLQVYIGDDNVWRIHNGQASEASTGSR